jgi:hydroxyacylglutathione hydrolase
MNRGAAMSIQIDRIRTGLTNSYLLRDRGTVLIDPGGPPGGEAGFRHVLPRLGRPPRLDLIVITHGHFDHVGAAGKLRDATGAPVAVHRADALGLTTGRVAWPRGVTVWGRVARNVLGSPLVSLLRAPIIEADLLLGDEGLDLEPYGVSGRIVHTPGHSPGSVSVLLPSGEAFVGDLAMNGPPMCLKPSFGIFADRAEQVRASWRQLVEMGARVAYPGHGRPFPVSALRA